MIVFEDDVLKRVREALRESHHDHGERVEMVLNCVLGGVTLVPEWRKPFNLLAERPSLAMNRGERTGIEPCIERYRREFCLSLPVDFNLGVLEALAA